MKSAAFCLLGLLLFFAVPAFASFHDNGNGTVTDSETGLTWQKTADTAAKNWQEALAACASLTLAGQSDWRLPNRNELQSIVDYRYAEPAIDTNFFPNTSGTFWTSTTSADNPSNAYTVDFSSGAVSLNDKASNSFQVRAVRGVATFVPPSSFFYNNGNGTVTDSRTGLVWRQVPLDADNDGTADALNWQEALAAATQLNFAGQTDWRLPNRNELQSIVDYRYAEPAIDTNIFPKVTSSAFWTSTTVVDSPSTAYMIDFSSGAVGFNDKASTQLSVLAVRGRSSISTGAFKFFGIPDTVTANTPFPLELIAEDSAFNGTVNLNIQDGGGVNPVSVTLTNGRWQGNVSITRSGRTRLIASYSPLNGGSLFGSSGWFEVMADQSVNADLEVTIVANKVVYSAGDKLTYSIYVKNYGESNANDVTIDIACTEGFAIEMDSCVEINDSTCKSVLLADYSAKFKANIPAGQYVRVGIYGKSSTAHDSITLTADAHDPTVHDPISENNSAVSNLKTDIPELPGEQEAELLTLPPVSSDPTSLDTVVLTHGLQEKSCEASELWSGSKSDPAQAGYLIQQTGLNLNIYQFFWKGACQEYCKFGYEPCEKAYKAARQNVYLAAQQLANLLYDKLGPNYNKKIHFVGHSLGTAVNAYAANIFLSKENKISKAQITILDAPDNISQIPGSSENDEQKWGFDKNFFAAILPFYRTGLSLYVDNYYAGDADSGSGVGSAITGNVFNRLLVKPYMVGDKLLSGESATIFDIDNDHSGVQQWYRWTMKPNEEENFEGNSVCLNLDNTWSGKPSGINASLNPCPEERGGWRESILVSDPAKFPSSNGGSAEATNSTVVETSGNYPYGCNAPSGNFVATVCTEAATSSPSFSKATVTSLATEPQIPKSYIEFTVTVPEFLRYLSFDYSFPKSGDGDYVYIFLDGVPVWKMSGDGLTAGETISSGLIPVRAVAGQKKLIIALYGVGEQNAQFSLNNFKFTTVVDTDGDGVADDEDAFPNNPNEWLDTDQDGIGNNADPDDDNDGIADSKDAFPLDPSEWKDTDGDGKGDNADADDDNDGFADTSDNCPLVANPNQEDENGYQDGDSIGDACETLSGPGKALPAALQLLLGN